MADIVHRIGVKSSLDAVYRALATRDGVAAWWSRHTQGESEVDGRLLVRFRDGDTEIGSVGMKVRALEPARRVLWQVVAGPQEWIGTTIDFELKQESDFAVVLFAHRGWKAPGEFMHHCSTKWAVFLMSLKSLLESGRGAPNPDDVKIDNWN